MLKRYTLALSALTALLFQTALIAHAEEATEAAAPEAAVEEAAAPAEAPAQVEVPESELIELIGYLTAQGGGIGMLQLNADQITVLTDSITATLLGEKTIQGMDPAQVQAAMEQARARAEAGQPAEEAPAEGEEAPAAELPEISAESIDVLGVIIVAQTGLLDFGFGPDDVALIRKGFLDGLADDEISAEVEAKLPAFQNYMQGRISEMQAKMAEDAAGSAEENSAAGIAYVESLKAEDSEIQTAESGLNYTILEPGAEQKPKMSDSVLVHYRGTRIDGTQFDSSYDRGQPAEFPLNGVVPGFGEGLTKIGEGGKIVLYIPSELAYGNNPRPGGAIQPGDTLVFECELIKINP